MATIIDRPEMKRVLTGIIEKRHYTGSCPSGGKLWVVHDGAIVLFTNGGNPYLAKNLLGRPGKVWELARLYAPDGHRKNLLSEAVSRSVRLFRVRKPEVEALVSYADPLAGHHGGVYRACSWIYFPGMKWQKVWRGKDGRIVPRRKFHSRTGGHLNKAEIEALGYEQVRAPGKIRFVKPLNRWARKLIVERAP